MDGCPHLEHSVKAWEPCTCSKRLTSIRHQHTVLAPLSTLYAGTASYWGFFLLLSCIAGTWSWQGDLLWVSRTLKDTMVLTDTHLLWQAVNFPITGLSQLDFKQLLMWPRSISLIASPSSHTQFATLCVWHTGALPAGVESHRFCAQRTVCGYGSWAVRKEGLCSMRVFCHSPVQVCVWDDKGNPSCGWSIPALVSAACSGLIQETCRTPSLCITEGLLFKCAHEWNHIYSLKYYALHHFK